jgi:hypothetical protein
VNLSRRTLFFLVIPVAMLVLYEPTPASLRWVNVALAALSLCWFVLFAVEDIGYGRRERRWMQKGLR